MSFSIINEVKLCDICEVGSSKRIYASEYTKSGIPFYRSKEVIEKSKGEEITENLYISKEKYEELDKKFGSPKKGDILLASIGANMGAAYYLNINERFYFKDGNVTWFKNFSEEADSRYIYYWLISKETQINLSNIAIGSAQKALTIDSLKKLNVKLTNIKYQKSIVNILSTLDKKIETNNQINKKLEEMAQAIFKQWFLDFEFPNEDGEPYKSSGGELVESEIGMIPKGWEIKKLKKYIKFIKGKKPKVISEEIFKNSEIYLTIDALNRNSVQYAINDKVILADKKDILMVMDGASSGTLYYGMKGIVGSTLSKVFINNDTLNSDILYYFLKINEENIKLHLTGSAIPHTDKEYINRLLIAIPNEKIILSQITKILADIRTKIILNNEENLKLINTRDLLLPKLMSGEIRVPVDSDEE